MAAAPDAPPDAEDMLRKVVARVGQRARRTRRQARARRRRGSSRRVGFVIGWAKGKPVR
ncbi:MAG: hypothetical protein QM756_44975 [Polyangiaceae bacterium]